MGSSLAQLRKEISTQARLFGKMEPRRWTKARSRLSSTLSWEKTTAAVLGTGIRAATMRFAPEPDDDRPSRLMQPETLCDEPRI